ncbi:ECF-type sigma factor [Rudaea sp.]|uniref:ECF-type sigma factor n=1 Tax=Rudaea sp. TaxID=2136325 RepID=UPI002ECFC6F3
MSEVTQLLRRASEGDEAAREPLYRLLYPELMCMAHRQLARSGTLSLDATALLHEAYLRLGEQGVLPDANQRVFFAYASKVMRSVIVDYVRQRGAQKRGGAVTSITLNTDLADLIASEHSITDVENALEILEQIDARACRVVEMRYFGGMTDEDIASVLGTSLATVRRDWRKARAFLYEQLN